MSVDDEGLLSVQPPDIEPRGLGFTSILTQIFGLPTTLDPDTQARLEERNALLRIEQRTEGQELQLIRRSEELKRLGFLLEDREPEYELFLRAFEGLKREGRKTFTPEEIAQKNEIAKRMLSEIMARNEASQ